MRRVYCIYDLIAGTFLGSPVVERGDAPVIRAFFDILAQKDSTPGQHPADFTLIYCGEISDAGVLLPADAPTTIATGASWLAAQG